MKQKTKEKIYRCSYCLSLIDNNLQNWNPWIKCHNIREEEWWSLWEYDPWNRDNPYIDPDCKRLYAHKIKVGYPSYYEAEE